MANVDLMVLAGDYVKSAVISEWKVKTGDKVSKGDILLEVETNKVVQGIESPCDGIVEKILFEEGDDVDISKTIAVIGDGSAVSDAASQTAEPEASAAQSAADTATGKRTVISPVAKKMAEEMGLDFDALAASYPGKRISKKDVLEFANNRADSKSDTAVAAVDTEVRPSAVTEIPIKGMRKTVGNAMRASAYSKPHVTMQTDACLDEMLKMKALIKEKYPDKKVTVTGLIALAAISALRDCPYMNGTATEEIITRSEAINLGIAVDVEDGLMVPIIRDAGKMRGLELFEAVNNTATSCRDGKLGPSDYAGGTFTISNIGSGGIRYFTPIINSPEIAILGVGASRKELCLCDGEIMERTVIGLSLSFDHAVVDGAPAAEFLKTLTEKIENPFMMSL